MREAKNCQRCYKTRPARAAPRSRGIAVKARMPCGRLEECSEASPGLPCRSRSGGCNDSRVRAHHGPSLREARRGTRRMQVHGRAAAQRQARGRADFEERRGPCLGRASGRVDAEAKRSQSWIRRPVREYEGCLPTAPVNHLGDYERLRGLSEHRQAREKTKESSFAFCHGTSLAASFFIFPPVYRESGYHPTSTSNACGELLMAAGKIQTGHSDYDQQHGDGAQ